MKHERGRLIAAFTIAMAAALTLAVLLVPFLPSRQPKRSLTQVDTPNGVAYVYHFADRDRTEVRFANQRWKLGGLFELEHLNSRLVLFNPEGYLIIDLGERGVRYNEAPPDRKIIDVAWWNDAAVILMADRQQLHRNSYLLVVSDDFSIQFQIIWDAKNMRISGSKDGNTLVVYLEGNYSQMTQGVYGQSSSVYRFEWELQDFNAQKPILLQGGVEDE